MDFEPQGGWACVSKIQSVGTTTVTTPGSGYSNVFPVTFTGGTPTRAATGVGYATAGAISRIDIIDAGAGYASAPTPVLTAGGGSSGVATAALGVLAPKQIAVVSCTLTPAQELLANNTLRGDYNAADPFNGKKSAAGQLVCIPNQQMIAAFMKAVVGGSIQNVVTGAGPYTHTAKLGALTPLSFVIEQQFNVAGSLRYQRGVGMRINQITIPIDATGGTPWTLDMMGSDVQANTTPYNASAPTDWRALGVPMDYTQLAAADVKLGGSAVGYIKKGSIQANFNLDGTDYRVGGAATRGSAVPNTFAQITGSLTLTLDNIAVLAVITAGTATSFGLKWTMGAGSFECDLDRLFIQKTGPVIKDGGNVDVDVQFRAAYDTTNQTSLRTITINDQPAASYL
jgi:hypothetical protein